MTKLTRGRVVAAILAALVLLALAAVLAGCTGDTGPTGATGTQGAKGDKGDPGVDATVACQACHDEAGKVSIKQNQWALSGHGNSAIENAATGETVYEYAGARNNCTSCHSGGGFTIWQAAGGPTSATVAPADNTPIDCRTCHNIHTTYTGADFALTTTAPVAMIVDATKVYDAGNSNLCANCHQPRTAAPVFGATASAQNVNHIPSTHYGPHHGPQATMLMGINGFGGPGEASPHYTQIEDGCVTCHMADDATIHEGGHTFNPTLEGCQSCHAELDTFDRHDVQTETQELLDQLKALLTQAGVFNADGSVNTTTEISDDTVGAYFNYIYVLEDGSLGVHNSFYAKELLEKSIADLS